MGPFLPGCDVLTRTYHWLDASVHEGVDEVVVVRQPRGAGVRAVALRQQPGPADGEPVELHLRDQGTSRLVTSTKTLA